MREHRRERRCLPTCFHPPLHCYAHNVITILSPSRKNMPHQRTHTFFRHVYRTNYPKDLNFSFPWTTLHHFVFSLITSFFSLSWVQCCGRVSQSKQDILFLLYILLFAGSPFKPSFVGLPLEDPKTLVFPQTYFILQFGTKFLACSLHYPSSEWNRLFMGRAFECWSPDFEFYQFQMESLKYFFLLSFFYL